MRLLAVTAAAAASLALVTGAAAEPAPSAATLADARCLLAMVALSNSDDENAKRLGEDGVVFFTGRISARDPAFDFKRLKSIAETMNNASAVDADLKQNCVPTLQKYMQQMGAALSPPDAGATAAPNASPPKP